MARFFLYDYNNISLKIIKIIHIKIKQTSTNRNVPKYFQKPLYSFSLFSIL